MKTKKPRTHLTPRHRKIIKERIKAGIPHEQIAQELGVATSTVSKNAKKPINYRITRNRKNKAAKQTPASGPSPLIEVLDQEIAETRLRLFALETLRESYTPKI